MVKTCRIVRLTESRIKVVFDAKLRKATNKRVHNLLADDVGAVIRRTAQWKKDIGKQYPKIEKVTL